MVMRIGEAEMLVCFSSVNRKSLAVLINYFIKVILSNLHLSFYKVFINSLLYQQ